MESKATTLNLDEYRKGYYPSCLDDAVSIIVSQERNSLGFGTDIGMFFQYEDAIKACEEKGDFYQARLLEQKATKFIDEEIINIDKRLLGMQNFGVISGYIAAFTHASKLQKNKASIAKPELESAQFEIFPHTFNLGYTGRLLTDGTNTFNEELHVNCSIYDAFDLAKNLTSKSILARMKDGSLKLLKKGSDRVGDYKTIKTIEDEVTIIFSEMKGWRITPKILENQNGLRAIASNEWKKISEKYDEERSFMFGTEHRYMEVIEAGLDSNYLFWKIAINSKRNPCIASMQRFMGEHKFPEEKNRYQILYNNAEINFGNVRIQFDRAHLTIQFLQLKI